MAAIEIRGVHKTFRIPHERHTTLTERLLSLLRPVEYERFEALRGIDLTVETGAFVGIIGRNGSGKSTLLKIMAGLLPPDQGEVHVEGTMSSLLELGLGFSPELTVRENVELYAAVLGYPRREVQPRIDAAIHFAELERFRDQKLKNLSTGMRARLGFATALQAESDTLLLDEILAVGDENFQRKCLDVFIDLKRQGRTIVLVSHDLSSIRTFCDYAVFIDAGRIGAQGAPLDVINAYLTSLGQAPIPSAPPPPPRRVEASIGPVTNPALYDGGISTDQIRFMRGWLEDESGNRMETVRPGERPILVARAEVDGDLVEPIFGLIVTERNGPIVNVMNTRWLGLSTGELRADHTVEVRMLFEAGLREGDYSVDLLVTNREITILYGKTGGFVDLPVRGVPVASATALELGRRFQCRVMVRGDEADRLPPAADVAEKGGVG
jgi:ABC-type polysaccharide/polyol phosphate transport system ATPase subunit